MTHLILDVAAEQKRNEHNIHTFIRYCLEVNQLWENSNFERDDIISMCHNMNYPESAINTICYIIDAVR